MSTMQVKILKDGRAYQALMQFARLPMGEKMTALTDVGDGEAFVQRIRVRMSRMRGKIKSVGKEIAQFRLEHVGTRQIVNHGVTFDEVTIKKTANGFTDVEELLGQIEPLSGLVSKSGGKGR